MRLQFLVLAALAALPLASWAEAPRPNIVLIVADDLGYSDLGSYGSSLSTPNLDRLAAEGVRFTQFYNGARCCPTRAAMLTGLYAHQAGVGHMMRDWTKFSPAYSTGLNRKGATFAELLHEAGYRNYHVGKWHVGGSGPKGDPDMHPLSRGFDRAYGTGGGGNYFSLQPLYRDREFIQPGENFYATEAFTENAVRFLEDHRKDHRDQPFLLQLCYTAPHFPLQARPEEIAKYRGKFRHGWDEERKRRFAKQQELGLFPKGTELSPRDPVAQEWASLSPEEQDKWDERQSIFAAMITSMDAGIGQVLETLKKLGVEENTLVLFVSDNGSSAEIAGKPNTPGSVPGSQESSLCLEIGWSNTANTPFRENKMWTQEGGISTPMIARWPAGIKQKGSLVSAVGHIIDFTPTFLELAGATYPKTLAGRELTPLAGRSFAPALRGEALPERTLAWEHEGGRAYRRGDWKLVSTFRKDWELYDLSKDRSEQHNLAAEQPEKVKEFSAAWEQWAKDVGVVPWEQLPGSGYKPNQNYRRKSEPVVP